MNILEFLHRYLIIRRSAYDPIVHPYYIEYGFNCIELYERMKSNSMIMI